MFTDESNIIQVEKYRCAVEGASIVYLWSFGN